MFRSPSHLCLLLAACLPLILVGCSSAPSPPSTASPPPSPAATFFAYADCGFGVSARAWVDADADGTWDRTEAPLAGVTVVMWSAPDGQVIASGPPSDATGAMQTSIVGGCARDPHGAATAVPPPGFIPTTPQPVVVPILFTPGVPPDVVEFGFQPTS